MAAFNRNIHIKSSNLGKEATLLFTFEDIDNFPRLYKDQYPVVWKVTTFGAEGNYDARMTYSHWLAFTRPQLSGDKIIGAATYVSLTTGQKTILTEANGVAHFSEPENAANVTPDLVQAVNKSGKLQEIALGFRASGSDPTPVLYWNDVGDESNVTAKFTPRLKVYVYSDYQENAVIRGAIQSPAIWTQDISRLGENIELTLTRDVAGHYKLA